MFFKKIVSKKDSIEALGFGRSEIVFALLNKVIAVYIELIVIYIKGSSFERPFLRFIEKFSSRSGRGLKL